ncbi:hypothetical protein NQT62_02090 [Limnobacter humi]|uniref:SH3 domain-containing protein n=1 Tax=Limnobacter humi TaxID=1778671 RepID=A0ABT1WCI5_9BURK|nr:hypothetical protein [Limnobacter humi]MCQ8895227.1 hypothetical protein [Limnobacter humi]
MKMCRFFILLVLLVFNTVTASASDRLLPVDEASLNPDFFAFRVQLQSAIARRDPNFLLNVISKDIFFSFGSESGFDDFVKNWDPSRPDSPVWPIMAETLALGGTFDSDGSFTAPYVFTNWPNDKDAFEFVAVIAADVPVYSQPSNAAPVIDHLSFSVVELANDQFSQASWTHIKLDQNRTGFMESSFLRSSLADRLRFSKIDGRWQISVFISGD